MKFLISISFGLLFFLASCSACSEGCAGAKSTVVREIVTQLSPALSQKDLQAGHIHHHSGPASYRTLHGHRMPWFASGSFSGQQAVEDSRQQQHKRPVHFGNAIGLLLIFPEHNFW